MSSSLTAALETRPDWLQQVLTKCELMKFYEPLITKLNITQPKHFDNVRKQDLEKIGLSGPGRRRLFKEIKVYRQLSKDRFIPIDERRISGLSEPATQAVSGGLIQEDELKLLEKLGDGFSGIVFKATWLKMPSGYVAVKQLKKNQKNPNEVREFLNEVNLMIPLHHKYLVTLYGVVLSEPIQMVTELAQNGCFREQLLASYPSLPTLHRFIKQLCQAMIYLSDERFIHRDIAARNVLVFSDDVVKLGDFGLMVRLSPDEMVHVMTAKRKIPLAWSAPESLARKAFSSKTDVFSFGVLMWEIFDRCRDPWPGKNGKEILAALRNGARLPPPRYANDSIGKIIDRCWKMQPEERPTFREILATFERTHYEIHAAQTAYRNPMSGQMLHMSAGDEIVVIRKESNHEEVWYGQNLRTLEIGLFPKQTVTGGRVPEVIKSLIPGRAAPPRPAKDPSRLAGTPEISGRGWAMKSVETIPLASIGLDAVAVMRKASDEQEEKDAHLYGDLDAIAEDLKDEFYDVASTYTSHTVMGDSSRVATTDAEEDDDLADMLRAQLEVVPKARQKDITLSTLNATSTTSQSSTPRNTDRSSPRSKFKSKNEQYQDVYAEVPESEEEKPKKSTPPTVDKQLFQVKNAMYQDIYAEVPEDNDPKTTTETGVDLTDDKFIRALTGKPAQPEKKTFSDRHAVYGDVYDEAPGEEIPTEPTANNFTMPQQPREYPQQTQNYPSQIYPSLPHNSGPSGDDYLNYADNSNPWGTGKPKRTLDASAFSDLTAAAFRESAMTQEDIERRERLNKMYAQDQQESRQIENLREQSMEFAPPTIEGTWQGPQVAWNNTQGLPEHYSSNQDTPFTAEPTYPAAPPEPEPVPGTAAYFQKIAAGFRNPEDEARRERMRRQLEEDAAALRQAAAQPVPGVNPGGMGDFFAGGDPTASPQRAAPTAQDWQQFSPPPQPKQANAFPLTAQLLQPVKLTKTAETADAPFPHVDVSFGAGAPDSFENRMTKYGQGRAKSSDTAIEPFNVNFEDSEVKKAFSQSAGSGLNVPTEKERAMSAGMADMQLPIGLRSAIQVQQGKAQTPPAGLVGARPSGVPNVSPQVAALAGVMNGSTPTPQPQQPSTPPVQFVNGQPVISAEATAKLAVGPDGKPLSPQEHKARLMLYQQQLTIMWQRHQMAAQQQQYAAFMQHQQRQAQLAAQAKAAQVLQPTTPTATAPSPQVAAPVSSAQQVPMTTPALQPTPTMQPSTTQPNTSTSSTPVLTPNTPNSSTFSMSTQAPVAPAIAPVSTAPSVTTPAAMLQTPTASTTSISSNFSTSSSATITPGMTQQFIMPPKPTLVNQFSSDFSTSQAAVPQATVGFPQVAPPMGALVPTTASLPALVPTSSSISVDAQPKTETKPSFGVATGAQAANMAQNVTDPTKFSLESAKKDDKPVIEDQGSMLERIASMTQKQKQIDQPVQTPAPSSNQAVPNPKNTMSVYDQQKLAYQQEQHLKQMQQRKLLGMMYDRTGQVMLTPQQMQAQQMQNQVRMQQQRNQMLASNINNMSAMQRQQMMHQDHVMRQQHAMAQQQHLVRMQQMHAQQSQNAARGILTPTPVAQQQRQPHPQMRPQMVPQTRPPAQQMAPTLLPTNVHNAPRPVLKPSTPSAYPNLDILNQSPVVTTAANQPLQFNISAGPPASHAPVATKTTHEDKLAALARKYGQKM